MSIIMPKLSACVEQTHTISCKNLSMFRRAHKILLAICLYAVPAFAQINSDAQFASLLMSSHYRLSYLRHAYDAQPSDSVSSEEDLSADLERMTREIVERELKSEQDLNPKLQQRIKDLWIHLKEVGYWEAIVKTLHKSAALIKAGAAEYSYNYKMQGLGFATFYSAFKIAGNIIGGTAFAKGRLDIVAMLNAFPYNTAAATLLNYPYQYIHRKRVEHIAGGKEQIKNLVRMIEQNRAASTSPFEGDLRLPLSNHSDSEVAASRIYGRYRDPDKSAKRIKKHLAKLIKEKTLEDRAIESLLKNKKLSPSFQFAAIWMRLQSAHPSIAQETLDTLEIKPLSADTAFHMPLSRETYNWVQQLMECNSEEALRKLYQSAPSNMNYLQRNDLWLNVFLPYLARHKAKYFSAFDFRPFLLKSEGQMADAIAFGPISAEQSHKRWMAFENELFPLSQNRGPFYKTFLNCKKSLGF